MLVQVGLLKKGREPGARRDHYRVGQNAWYEMFVARAALMRQWEAALAEGVEVLGADRPGGRRVAKMRDFLSFFREELSGLTERWREHPASGQRAKR